MILATVNAPDGATLEYTAALHCARSSASACAYPEFDRVFVVTGNPTVSQGIAFLRTVDWERAQAHARSSWRASCSRKFAGLPGVHGVPGHAAVAGPGLSRAADQLRDRQLRQLREPVAGVRSRCWPRWRKNPGFVQPDTDLRLNKPELFIEVDRDRAADAGVAVDAGGAHHRDHARRPQRDALQARRRAVRRDRADRERAAAPRRRTSTTSSCAAATTRWCRWPRW